MCYDVVRKSLVAGLFHLPYQLTVEGYATVHPRLDAWVVLEAGIAGLNSVDFVPLYVGLVSYQDC